MIKSMRLLAALVTISALAGCATSKQLERSSLGAGATITEMEYQMVLNNLAMLIQSTNALPQHVRIGGGDILVADTLGLGTPNLSYAWSPWSWGAGTSASRKMQESWTIIPETDVNVLTKMQGIYLRSIKADWLNHGAPPAGNTGLTGNYGATWVWVDNSRRQELTKLTLEIMDASNAGALKRGGLATPGVAPSYLIQ